MVNLELEGALTFFYYNELEEASDFYEEVMGFCTVGGRLMASLRVQYLPS